MIEHYVELVNNGWERHHWTEYGYTSSVFVKPNRAMAKKEIRDLFEKSNKDELIVKVIKYLRNK